MRKKLLILIFILTMITALVLTLPSLANASSITQPTYSNLAREMLSDYEKALYDQLFIKIQALKNTDDEQLTEFEIDLNNLGGAKCLWSDDDTFPAGITDVKDAFRAQFNFKKVYNALMHDMPLELYWYDKTSAGGATTLVGSVNNTKNNTKEITKFIIRLQVTSMHRGDTWDKDLPTVKGVKSTYDTVYENAMQYVNKYDGKSDYVKIKGYVEDICSLVDYAIIEPSTLYSDVWQPTYVFDNDPYTDVVCEGYSKAFQLLCNLSTFSNTTCYTISGYTNGGHMWNVVTIDGLSYLIDVTNSDDTKIGQDGELTLKAPESGDYDTNYYFTPGITYTYDDDSKTLWGDSVLTLSMTDYEVPPVNFTLISQASDGGFVYDGEAITIGASETFDIYYSLEYGDVNDYSWTFSYHQDDNGKIGSPVSYIRNVGVYWIKVDATKCTDDTIKGSTTIKVQITPKQLTIASVSVSGKVYDNTTAIAFNSAVLDGLVGSDDVRLSADSTFSLPQADAGIYNFVCPNELIFEGSDKDNYVYSPSDYIPLSESVSVTKRNIDITSPVFEYATSETTFEQFNFNVSGLYDDEIVTGTIRWYDGSHLPITDLTTHVKRGEVYTWELVFNNTNFNNATGTLEIYPDETLYNVTATVDATTKGTTSTGGRQNYLSGESVTLTAVAKSGYQFDCWIINGVEASTSSTYTFAITNNVTAQARFKQISTTPSGNADDTDMLTKILEVVKTLIPYLPYVIIGGGVLGLTILILLYVKISKSAKRKKRLKNISK